MNRWGIALILLIGLVAFGAIGFLISRPDASSAPSTLSGQDYSSLASCDKKFREGSTRELCYSVYYAEVARDFSGCERLTSDAALANCYYIAARNTKDVSYCLKVPSTVRDPTNPNNLSPARDVCFSVLAALTENRTLCASITNVELQTQCETNVR